MSMLNQVNLEFTIPTDRRRTRPEVIDLLLEIKRNYQTLVDGAPKPSTAYYNDHIRGLEDAIGMLFVSEYIPYWQKLKENV